MCFASPNLVEHMHGAVYFKGKEMAEKCNLFNSSSSSSDKNNNSSI
jgi:hypothetical protein